jgi:hypothetical protein
MVWTNRPLNSLHRCGLLAHAQLCVPNVHTLVDEIFPLLCALNVHTGVAIIIFITVDKMPGAVPGFCSRVFLGA